MISFTPARVSRRSHAEDQRLVRGRRRIGSGRRSSSLTRSTKGPTSSRGRCAYWRKEADVAGFRLTVTVSACLTLALDGGPALAQGLPAPRPYRYCVPAATIDLNPFRRIEDGKEMIYLLALTRPYIATS